MRPSIIRFGAVAAGVVLLAVSVAAAGHKYSVGGGGGVVLMTGGDFFSFDRKGSYGFSLGHRLGDSWLINLGYAAFELSNDVEQDSISSIGDLSNNSALRLEATRLTLTVDRLLFSPDRRCNMTVALGGGILVWKAVNPTTNTTYHVEGEKQETTDFAATELLLSSSTALLVRPLSAWSVNLRIRADYLTGAGAEFESAIKSARDRWLLGISVRLNLHFGRSEAGPRWRSDETRSGDSPITPVRKPSRDGDNDGVADNLDRCFSTPRGAVVDKFGCPLDTDGDGVCDGLDDCPATSREAQGMVDINGCPVDSDFDGIPDYQDACADNAVGALVDPTGCPTDSDGDGVADGLDDCPHTLVGIAVDRHGCIDLSMFSEPMVLNIDYAPGSFEVDPINKERIEKLAGLLNFVTDVKLEISGYTDNIGTSLANRKLSEKRARRVRYYLEMLGIAPERMKVFGRGETNFVASNQTADGRARNRRIEIMFYR